MSQVKIQGNASGTGIFTVAAPNSNTDRTLTLPDNTGTVLTDGSTYVPPKGTPAFSAIRTANQTGVSGNTWTKIQLNVEDFDTASCFDSSTNYRFTPNVAGYYQINACVQCDTSSQYNGVGIYKNGSLYVRAWTNNEYATTAFISTVVYLNGSTDYIELFGQISTSGTFFSAAERGCNMSGVLVRAA